MTRGRAPDHRSPGRPDQGWPSAMPFRSVLLIVADRSSRIDLSTTAGQPTRTGRSRHTGSYNTYCARVSRERTPKTSTADLLEWSVNALDRMSTERISVEALYFPPHCPCSYERHGYCRDERVFRGGGRHRALTGRDNGALTGAIHWRSRQPAPRHGSVAVRHRWNRHSHC